ncbi:MAG: ATP-binding protein [Dehalococcoidia bacterium]|nr:ATP-binding protein [Dehalococcoidia bacterium]
MPPAQLAKCCNWISATHRRNLATHEFPWSKVDDSNIETEGFIRDAFEFTIDQAKVLDLLTGQTLYNDSSVVLRELVQNSLDAIKLRLYDHPNSAPGEVRITWDSSNRVLTVTDNGTGMTQETIRNHLLRVGASLYQDQEFKKSHPDFSGISRFGIGVLSAFMIADSVEVITCHEAETSARRLALRSVHGKYLIRVLDKHTEPAASLAPHGTMIRLKVRQSVKMPDVVRTAKRWIVLPNCKVTLAIDNGEPIAIGFSSPKEVLIDCLRSCGYEVVNDIETQPESASGKNPVCVVQHNVGCVTIAYGVRWSPYFHEWSFLADRVVKRSEWSPIGTCVEGIRVDTNTPGFRGTGIFALANATGENAPKTNVARSGLESGPQLDALLRAVYRAYGKHAEIEIDNLTKSRGHSLTWAVQEAQYLLTELLEPGLGNRPSDSEIISRDILVDTLRELPIILTESSSGRAAASVRCVLDYRVSPFCIGRELNQGDSRERFNSRSSQGARRECRVPDGDTSLCLNADINGQPSGFLQ